MQLSQLYGKISIIAALPFIRKVVLAVVQFFIINDDIRLNP